MRIFFPICNWEIDSVTVQEILFKHSQTLKTIITSFYLVKKTGKVNLTRALTKTKKIFLNLFISVPNFWDIPVNLIEEWNSRLNLGPYKKIYDIFTMSVNSRNALPNKLKHIFGFLLFFGVFATFCNISANC